ncbi:hypothetical protein Q8F55_008883 [Vanrija albida]|uniref:BTB domain-containing protein n=1 Tax=Vanrija albida TaxID=181172 RepID=A0ABR3PSC6_9TREE
MATLHARPAPAAPSAQHTAFTFPRARRKPLPELVPAAPRHSEQVPAMQHKRAATDGVESPPPASAGPASLGRASTLSAATASSASGRHTPAAMPFLDDKPRPFGTRWASDSLPLHADFVHDGRLLVVGQGEGAVGFKVNGHLLCVASAVFDSLVGEYVRASSPCALYLDDSVADISAFLRLFKLASVVTAAMWEPAWQPDVHEYLTGFRLATKYKLGDLASVLGAKIVSQSVDIVSRLSVGRDLVALLRLAHDMESERLWAVVLADLPNWGRTLNLFKFKAADVDMIGADVLKILMAVAALSVGGDLFEDTRGVKVTYRDGKALVWKSMGHESRRSSKDTGRGHRH